MAALCRAIASEPLYCCTCQAYGSSDRSGLMIAPLCTFNPWSWSKPNQWFIPATLSSMGMGLCAFELRNCACWALCQTALEAYETKGPDGIVNK